VVDGIRHEDALALSFADESLGTIVSNDVYEHVPDIDAALAEAVRVLRPDGLLMFSVPFYDTRDRTERRAELRDGEVVELLEPQYHGNPVDEKGSLVFYDYGWDVLDRCRAVGFADAYAVAYWSAFHGYLGGGLQLLFVARRRSDRQ
jgi:SAM-dependent methyltransferase